MGRWSIWLWSILWYFYLGWHISSCTMELWELVGLSFWASTQINRVSPNWISSFCQSVDRMCSSRDINVGRGGTSMRVASWIIILLDLNSGVMTIQLPCKGVWIIDIALMYPWASSQLHIGAFPGWICKSFSRTWATDGL